MAKTENSLAIQEYRKQDVVRIVPIQPISPEKLREKLSLSGKIGDLAEISLVDIIMIERNGDAPNPEQLLFPGGRMKKDASLLGSAQLQLDDEIHASGMRPGMIYEFHDTPRPYHFKAQYPNGYPIERDNNEHWTIGMLPPDFYELPLYLADNIARIHRLSPVEVDLLFEYGEISFSDREFELVDNLNGDGVRRLEKNVTTDHEATERLRGRIRSEVSWQERRHRALLAFELAYPTMEERNKDDARKSDLQTQADDLLAIMVNTSNESYPYFDETYGTFLKNYYEKNKGFDIPQMIGDSWERVITRMRVRHFADIPQQGNSLMARLRLDQGPVSDVVLGGFLDELSKRDAEQLDIGVRFAAFVLDALSPPFLYGDRPDKPKNQQEIERRLGDLHRMQLANDKRWEQHVVKCYTQAFEITEDELGIIIPLSDEDSDRFQIEYASQLGENSTTPRVVSQSDELKTSNLASLLLFTYKINPYREDGWIFGNEEHMAYGARKKLLRIPQWVNANRFRTEYIQQNTTDGFQKITQELFKKNGAAYTVGKEEGKNVLEFRETILNCAGVPIVMAYQRSNKELYSMVRKAYERGMNFIDMTDIFRAAFEIDSTSEAISEMLHRLYDRLKNETKMPEFDDWKKEWEHEAIRTVYRHFETAAKKRDWMYWVPKDMVKDKLVSQSRTGGSRASGGNIEFFKWIHVINRHMSRGSEVMEVQGFPSIAAKDKKDSDDLIYALKRVLLANPGLLPVVQLWLDPSLSPGEYEDMMRWLSRQEKNGNGNH